MEMTWALFRLERSSLDNHAELLRIGRAGLALGERGGDRGGDADPGFAVLTFEDVRQMLRRGYPGRDHRLRRRQDEGAPGEILADHVADGGSGDIPGRADPVDGSLAAR